MGLFRRGGGGESSRLPAQQETNPLTSRRIFCRVCNSDQEFTRCWRRVRMQRGCVVCREAFDDPKALYKAQQPVCPRCGECLEQPGFDYGLCDGCGSRYEIVEGTKPSLLPNKEQRAEMDKHGKSRSV